ncbi:MAG: zinc ribbon domain-containing protein [Actinomycetota bacterium]|nr:zinc ribbon domain-containing protein [Actinomycetota bacterium]
MKKCEFCGTENPDVARFCTKCGKKLEESGASPEGKEYYLNLEKQSISPRFEEDIASREKGSSEIDLTRIMGDLTKGKKTCARCGFVNPREQKYCKNCGAPLEEEAKEVESLPIPLAPEPIEPSFISESPSIPASDYYESGTAGEARTRRFDFMSGVSNWGAGEWVAIIGAVVVVVIVAWLFIFGGYQNIFGAPAKNIKKAAKVMVGLNSFEYSLNVNLRARGETSSRYHGSGKVLFESPDKTYWEMNLLLPARGATPLRFAQIGKKSYMNASTGWQMLGEDSPSFGIERLWSGFSMVEDLGMAPIGTSNCAHYRYRIPPEIIASIVGADPQAKMGDAVVESWIDSGTNQVLLLQISLFKVLVDGIQMNASMALNLSSVGTPYNILPPI